MALVFVSLALLQVGCGSGGSSSTAATGGSTKSDTVAAPATAPAKSTPATTSTAASTGAGELSRTQLISKADEICKKLNSTLASLNKGASTSLASLARELPHNAELEEEAFVELIGLKPPSSLASEWHKLLKYRLTLAGELAKLAEAAKRGETATVKKLIKSKKSGHQALREAATHAGFQDCGVVG
jgi:hypothetical protein